MIDTSKDFLLEHIVEVGLIHCEYPVKLSSGASSNYIIDAKAALSESNYLIQAARRILNHSSSDFDAVGGMTMGADALSVSTALVEGCSWFSIRKEGKKQHGTGNHIEGFKPKEGSKVLIVEDVTTTGNSMVEATKVVKEYGAIVIEAISLIDRGTTTAERFEELNIPYRSIYTYWDLGIEPI